MREDKPCYDGTRSQGISSAEEYEMVARLLKSAEEKDREETSVDKDITPILNGIMTENGLVGRARAFGKRRKRVILACEDQGGSRISSKALRQDIEKALGISLSAPEYYRKDKMALMECHGKRRLKVSMATVSSAGHMGEVSGDTAVCFETEDDYYYALISDGMGSGEIARETSLFVCDFLSSALSVGSVGETVIHMLNHTLRSRAEECSATVDLLEIDMIRGEGRFIKSGAAPSYVKRGSSIFRVKSQTAPLGLLSSVDAEKIKLDVKAGDYVIMLSDGVADETDDAAWLLLLLGEPPKKSLTDYARLILEEAKKNSAGSDDKTVAVIRIDEA
jgi:stage II sporulation protein E